MESNCCGALPIGETYDNLGFCSECKEHAEFKDKIFHAEEIDHNTQRIWRVK